MKRIKSSELEKEPDEELISFGKLIGKLESVHIGSHYYNQQLFSLFFKGSEPGCASLPLKKVSHFLVLLFS